jgi:precorrin-6B methylase 2
VHPSVLLRNCLKTASEKFAKVLLKGGGDIEAVLQRLDRLTDEEARMTVAQTLEVVYGLMTNVKSVMESAPSCYTGS